MFSAAKAVDFQIQQRQTLLSSGPGQIHQRQGCVKPAPFQFAYNAKIVNQRITESGQVLRLKTTRYQLDNSNTFILLELVHKSPRFRHLIREREREGKVEGRRQMRKEEKRVEYNVEQRLDNVCGIWMRMRLGNDVKSGTIEEGKGGRLEGDDDGLEVRGSRKEGKNVYNSTHGLLIHLENTEMN